jgi:hypothetical protein
LGYFFDQANVYNFDNISIFKTWFVVGISRFQKWFVVDLVEFQIELCCIFLVFLAYLATFLVTLSRNWAIFSQSSGHPESKGRRCHQKLLIARPHLIKLFAD